MVKRARQDLPAVRHLPPMPLVQAGGAICRDDMIGTEQLFALPSVQPHVRYLNSSLSPWVDCRREVIILHMELYLVNSQLQDSRFGGKLIFRSHAH